MPERKRTKAEERAYAELFDTARLLDDVRLQLNLRFERLKHDNLPPGWAGIEADVPVRPHKTKVHAAFDADLVRFFRTMGHGYQARMNAVLRAYMLMILSRQIGSKKNEDWMGNEI